MTFSKRTTLAVFSFVACAALAATAFFWLRAGGACAARTDAGVVVTFNDGTSKTFANNHDEGEARAEYSVLGAFCRQGVVVLRYEGWETMGGYLIDLASKEEIPTEWVERLSWLSPRRSFAIYACDVTTHDDPTAGCLTTLYSVDKKKGLKSLWSRREERTLNVIDWKPSEKKYSVTVRSYTATTGLEDKTDLTSFEALKNYDLDCTDELCTP